MVLLAMHLPMIMLTRYTIPTLVDDHHVLLPIPMIVMMMVMMMMMLNDSNWILPMINIRPGYIWDYHSNNRSWP